MAELLMVRLPTGGFAPATDEDAEAIRKIKTGAFVRVEVKQMRNVKFHRKFFSLAKFAFDIWSDTLDPQEYKGVPVEPNFDRFRKDLVVLTGRFDAVYNAFGEVRVEAKSISFANMSEDEFEKLYSDAINVILKKILVAGTMTEQELRDHVETVLHYA